MSVDLDHLREWEGREEIAFDTVTLAPMAALAATLDREDKVEHGSRLPELWHWLYFLPLHRQSELAPDGHAHRGGFLPPVPLPRRMWAGSRVEFIAPVRAGDALRRVSRIQSVVAKNGRTGPLVFLTVRHEVLCGDELRIADEHDIVYRDHSSTEVRIEACDRSADWQRTIVPDDALLFRYSALTFNAHRIHYDRRYCTEVEHYPGLVVHGPLIATLLMDLLRRNLPETTVAFFQFKARRPAFDGNPLHLRGARNGNTVSLWAADQQGLLLEAEVLLR